MRVSKQQWQLLWLFSQQQTHIYIYACQGTLWLSFIHSSLFLPGNVMKSEPEGCGGKKFIRHTDREMYLNFSTLRMKVRLGGSNFYFLEMNRTQRMRAQEKETRIYTYTRIIHKSRLTGAQSFKIRARVNQISLANERHGFKCPQWYGRRQLQALPN